MSLSEESQARRAVFVAPRSVAAVVLAAAIVVPGALTGNTQSAEAAQIYPPGAVPGPAKCDGDKPAVYVTYLPGHGDEAFRAGATFIVDGAVARTVSGLASGYWYELLVYIGVSPGGASTADFQIVSSDGSVVLPPGYRVDRLDCSGQPPIASTGIIGRNINDDGKRWEFDQALNDLSSVPGVVPLAEGSGQEAATPPAATLSASGKKKLVFTWSDSGNTRIRYRYKRASAAKFKSWHKTSKNPVTISSLRSHATYLVELKSVGSGLTATTTFSTR